MLNYNILPLVVVLLPVFATLIRPFLERKRHYLFTAITTCVTFLLVVLMYPQIKGGGGLEYVIDTGLGFNFDFFVSPLEFLMGLVSSFLWMIASIYAIEYMEHSHSHDRYNTFSLLSLAGMLGIVFAKNLFSLYIFFELLCVASTILVFHEETPEAMRAGFKYLFLGIAGGLVLLFSIIATYQISGHGELSRIGIGLKDSPWLPYIFWGYVIGFGVKAGIFPLHIWLPSAHPVAPSPASALLSGVMIKAGAYGIFKTVYNIIGFAAIVPAHINMSLGLLIIAIITILLGSAVAITQTEIKRMLAYSSISQIGYVVMGIALLSPLGIVGSLMHIFGHALMKGALFLSAGAIIYKIGLRQIKDLRGLGRRMPIVTGVFTVAALSMIGLPPMVGFISKWFLALGSLQLMKMGTYWPGMGVICLLTLLLSSLLNLIYYGPIVIGAWFAGDSEGGHGGHNSSDNSPKNDDPGLFMTIPLAILGVLILFFGIFPGLPLSLAKSVSSLFFSNLFF